MMRQITLVTLLIAVASSNLITAANAQGRFDDRDNRRNAYRERIEDLLGRIENGTDRLRSSVDDALDDSRLNNTNREDEINEFFRELEKDTNDLKNRYRSGDSVRTEVQEVLASARRIDNFIQRYDLNEAEDEWEAMERDLEQLKQIVDAAGRRDNRPIRR